MMNCKIHESNIRQDSPLLDMLSSKLSLADSPDEWQGESEDKEKRKKGAGRLHLVFYPHEAS